MVSLFSFVCLLLLLFFGFSNEQAKALGAVLFEQVCKQLNLLESDYFGLEYVVTASDRPGSAVTFRLFLRFFPPCTSNRICRATYLYLYQLCTATYYVLLLTIYTFASLTTYCPVVPT